MFAAVVLHIESITPTGRAVKRRRGNSQKHRRNLTTASTRARIGKNVTANLPLISSVGRQFRNNCIMIC